MPRHYLDDVQGPDEVRVTVAIEPAVARLQRLREMFGLREFYLPLNRAANRVLANATQRFVLGSRWVVDVETDSGLRARVTCPTRSEAERLAEKTRTDIAQRGVDAVTALR